MPLKFTSLPGLIALILFGWLMGIPTKDCFSAGQILGERIVLNEFIGYLSLSKQPAMLDPRSCTLATYAR